MTHRFWYAYHMCIALARKSSGYIYWMLSRGFAKNNVYVVVSPTTESMVMRIVSFYAVIMVLVLIRNVEAGAEDAAQPPFVSPIDGFSDYATFRP